MKKIISVFLLAVLLSSISSFAFAEEEKTEGTMAVGGMEFDTPLKSIEDYIERIKNKQGRILK